MTALEVVIVRHRKERRSKCTLQPLVGREGLRFLTWPLAEVPALEGYVRLAPDAPELGADDAGKGVLLLDATWKLVEPMNRAFAHIEPRSLPPLETAYPRTSKLFDDPDAGLASVEALYAAMRILGRPTEGLLDGYLWRDEFLRKNAGKLP